MDAAPVFGKTVPMQSLQGIQQEASRLSDVLTPTSSRSRQGEAQEISNESRPSISTGTWNFHVKHVQPYSEND